MIVGISTTFSQAALYILALLCVSLTVYLLFGGWFPTARRQPVRLIWLMLPFVLFIPLWLCGRYFWTVLFWLQLGDDGRYDIFGKWVSVATSLIVSTIAFVRMATGLVNQRYLIISLSGTVLTCILCVTIQVHEFINPILGWTARGAAENHFSRVRVQNRSAIGSNTRRIVELENPKWTSIQRPAKKFAIFEGPDRVAEITVVPYGWWWWRGASSKTGKLAVELSDDE